MRVNRLPPGSCPSGVDPKYRALFLTQKMQEKGSFLANMQGTYGHLTQYSIDNSNTVNVFINNI